MLVYGDRPRLERTADKLAALARADRLTALIEAGELAQGLADAEFARLGCDDDTPLHAAAMALCVTGDAAPLAALPLPPEITVKTPEGYAFYGLHPDRYAEAARAHPWPSPPFVIGLRSIGTSLAGVVAAATGARDVISVRPVGHPFRRELRLSPALRARLAAHAGPFAVVDEGPGRSGSSFGAAADLLESLGVAPARIVFLPGHAGDLGPEASAAHRARWATATRLVCARPPPAGRFIGLGRYGEAKLARAKALHAAGFGPQPLALRDGWLTQAPVHGPPAPPSPQRLAAYLRFRREHFPAPLGASPAELIEMVRVNSRELFGRDLDFGLDALPLDRARPRPVHVDARLHAANWAGGLKLDALDGSEAHDLIGPQDIAWDVAGAAVELGLRVDAGADPVLLKLFEVAYPAFHAGRAVMFGADPAPYRARLARLQRAPA